MLGGTIRLESEKGEGSRFTVELPMNTADIGIEEQTAAESLAHIERPYSVIVLDDNPMVLSMTKEMYAGIGVHCDTFTTIGDAMEAMRQHTYDLMITDMKMPEINGYEVLELLRSSSVSNSKEIPIVVATASGSCSEEELLENGFTACLFKPFSISELVAVSDKCLLTSTDKDELPDLSSLLAYGDKRAMLDRLITETEKDMQAVREIMERNDRKALDEWIAIFRGKITNWKQLGGPDMKIIVYSRETSSGTYEFFKESALKNKNYMSSSLSMPATGAVIQSVSQTKGAIGYVGLAYLSPRVKAIAVSYDDGKHYVLPSLENGKKKLYPVVRPLYYYYNVANKEKVTPFIDYILSPEGQNIIKNGGYIPVK